MKKFIDAAIQRLHVIKHQQGWVLWKSGNLVVPEVYPSKEAAILQARRFNTADELIIHRKDGTVESIERGIAV